MTTKIDPPATGCALTPEEATAMLTTNNDIDHRALVATHLERFSTMSESEKERFTMLLTKGLSVLSKNDAVTDEVVGKVINHKMKFWAAIIVLSVVGINITALVTATLVIGVRTGRLPEIAPITGLIKLALDILKTVFAA